MSKWNWWEIPLGIATGGSSALAHLGYDATEQIANRVGSAVGSAAKNIGNEAIDRQEAFNSAEAQKQRDWEEQMSNTAVQRQVADIKAAGLNPWLALNGGSVAGASTPSGATASSNSAFANVYGTTQLLGTFTKALTSMANSAMQVVGNVAKAAAVA